MLYKTEMKGKKIKIRTTKPLCLWTKVMSSATYQVKQNTMALKLINKKIKITQHSLKGKKWCVEACWGKKALRSF